MYREEIYTTQHKLAEKSLFLMRELLPLMAPVGSYKGWSNENASTIGSLLSASARSTESALLLIAYGQLWDAEVIIRSVFEGTLKFAYLVQSHDKFQERYREFADEQPDIAALQDDKKVRELLNALNDPEADSWRPLHDTVLPDKRREELSEKYPKKVRRQMDMKWGYGNILSSLSNSNDKLFMNFTGLAYGYSLSSHIHHADFIGISLPIDRDRRSEERRELIHLAHLGRLISDCFSCFKIRLFSGYRFVGSDISTIMIEMKKIDHLHAEFEAAEKRWAKSEYNLY